MSQQRIHEVAIVVALLIGYLSLWRLKRARDMRRTGIDPEVLSRAASPVQAYFASLVKVITGLVVAIIAFHAMLPETWPPLSRWRLLDRSWVDWLGAVVGISGLGLCAVAQATMGASWRVGIDPTRRTELVSTGIYRLIRNPTYLGLHVLNLGLWLVWPTTMVAAYAVLFFVIMDIQVRCEEEHLSSLHGEIFTAYARRTWRYVPWIYWSVIDMNGHAWRHKGPNAGVLRAEGLGRALGTGGRRVDWGAI